MSKSTSSLSVNTKGKTGERTDLRRKHYARWLRSRGKTGKRTKPMNWLNMTPGLAIFLWGAGGSVAVEIVTLWGYYEQDKNIPARYRQIGFWIVRVLLAIMAGGLALAYDIQKPLLAANIGAATPLIIRAFAEGLRPKIDLNASAPKPAESPTP